MAKPKNRLLLILVVFSISTAAVFFSRSALDSCDSLRDGAGAAAAAAVSDRALSQRQRDPLDFMRSKRVLLVSHELSLSGGPLLLMELDFLLRGVGTQVVWITNQKSAEINEVTYSLEHKMLNQGVQLLYAKGQEATDAALKADLVVLNTAVAGKWLDPVLREHVPKVLPKILWWIHEMRGHYFKLEYVKHLPSVAGAMIDSRTTAEYWKNRTRERLGVQMPQTYVVHLGNSKELMEVAKDNVARRVLREHIRESLGVRNDDLLFAIINIFDMKGKKRETGNDISMCIAYQGTSGEGFKVELNCKIEDVVNNCLHLNSRSVVSCCVQHGHSRCWIGVSRGKGQDLFLHSFHESLQLIQEQKLQVPSMHAVVVGSDMNSQAKFEMELRDFVYKKGIQGHVHFVNKTLTVAPYLAAIDVLVQNSQARGECFGRITIEAMAFQLPVLGTAAGGTTEIVVDGSTGLLHPVGKEGITPLAKNIVKLATHVERRLTMGRKGYERVKERFMEHHMSERIAVVLKEVIQKSKAWLHP